MSTEVKIPSGYTLTFKGDASSPIHTDSTVALEAPEDAFPFHFDWADKAFKTENSNAFDWADKAFKTESTNTIEIPNPITNNVNLDVQPVVLDHCININIGKLPPTRIRQPINTRVGFTLFGVELFGINLVGEAQTIVDEYVEPPKVVWGAEEKRAKPKVKKGRTHRESQGIKIRLKD